MTQVQDHVHETKPFHALISLIILRSVCHTILMMLVLRIC